MLKDFDSALEIGDHSGDDPLVVSTRRQIGFQGYVIVFQYLKSSQCIVYQRFGLFIFEAFQGFDFLVDGCEKKDWVFSISGDTLAKSIELSLESML